jgi:hypothetical protein
MIHDLKVSDDFRATLLDFAESRRSNAPVFWAAIARALTEGDGRLELVFERAEDVFNAMREVLALRDAFSSTGADYARTADAMNDLLIGLADRERDVLQAVPREP